MRHRPSKGRASPTSDGLAIADSSNRRTRPAYDGISRTPTRPLVLDVAGLPRSFPSLNATANPKLRLLWINCGTDHVLIGVAPGLHNFA